LEVKVFLDMETKRLARRGSGRSFNSNGMRMENAKVYGSLAV
jgi:hypothetical protein